MEAEPGAQSVKGLPACQSLSGGEAVRLALHFLTRCFDYADGRSTTNTPTQSGAGHYFSATMRPRAVARRARGCASRGICNVCGLRRGPR